MSTRSTLACALSILMCFIPLTSACAEAEAMTRFELSLELPAPPEAVR